MLQVFIVNLKPRNWPVILLIRWLNLWFCVATIFYSTFSKNLFTIELSTKFQLSASMNDYISPEMHFAEANTMTTRFIWSNIKSKIHNLL